MRRTLLGLLVVTGLVVGGWAYLDPAGWYATFPGLGRHWLPPLGPYNEHLAKDTGALYLALAVVTCGALRRSAGAGTVRAVAAAWTVFNALHLIYHVPHLHVYDTVDQVLNVVGLGGLLAVSASLLLVRPAPEGKP